ncbi:MAG: matrixin family metalloprotease [Alphaproteobacteria bacterium]
MPVRRYFLKMAALGILGLAFVASMASSALAGDAAQNDGYALLSLDGRHVKWGEDRFGFPATVRYAFVQTRTSRTGGRNCREMRPFPAHFGSGNVSFANASSEIRTALSAWSTAAAIQFVEATDPDTVDFLIGVQAKPSGIAYADVVRASSRHAAPAPAPIRHAAICFNPELAWKTDFDGASGSFDLRYVAMHEIGHILGLDHTGARDNTVMSFRYRENYRLPQPGDIAGIRFLYGPAPVLAAIGIAPDPVHKQDCAAVSLHKKTAGHRAPPFPLPTGIDRVAITGCANVNAGSTSSRRTSEAP